MPKWFNMVQTKFYSKHRWSENHVIHIQNLRYDPRILHAFYYYSNHFLSIYCISSGNDCYIMLQYVTYLLNITIEIVTCSIENSIWWIFPVRYVSHYQRGTTQPWLRRLTLQRGVPPAGPFRPVATLRVATGGESGTWPGNVGEFTVGLMDWTVIMGLDT